MGLQMRKDAKQRVRDLLRDTNLIPRELIILGRSLNITRAVNKEMGSPVNRAKVLAQYAAMGLDYTPPHARNGSGDHHHHNQNHQNHQNHRGGHEHDDGSPHQLALTSTISARMSEFSFWL